MKAAEENEIRPGSENFTRERPGESGSGSSAAENKRRILRARAQKLARRPESDTEGRESTAVIEFTLAHERYAAEVEYVREVYPFKELTSVPCTPSFILGVINVRGQVLSVMDVKEFFDLPPRGVDANTRVLILENDDMELGLLADSVVGDVAIPVEAIQSDIRSTSGPKGQYIKGITKDRLILLDVNKLLSDDAIVVQEEVGD